MCRPATSRSGQTPSWQRYQFNSFFSLSLSRSCSLLLLPLVLVGDGDARNLVAERAHTETKQKRFQPTLLLATAAQQLGDLEGASVGPRMLCRRLHHDRPIPPSHSPWPGSKDSRARLVSVSDISTTAEARNATVAANSRAGFRRSLRAADSVDRSAASGRRPFQRGDSPSRAMCRPGLPFRVSFFSRCRFPVLHNRDPAILGKKPPYLARALATTGSAPA
ncbi:hypothetical protein BJ546DRAFT_369650 [Cryomyces antarcticus]